MHFTQTEENLYHILVRKDSDMTVDMVVEAFKELSKNDYFFHERSHFGLCGTEMLTLTVNGNECDFYCNFEGIAEFFKEKCYYKKALAVQARLASKQRK